VTGALLAAALMVLGAAAPPPSDPADAPAGTDAAATPAPARPAPMFNRWQEDWSVLADPAVPREPLDGLKYIPFAAGGQTDWLTLGAQLRERFESNEEPGFGITPGQGDAYVISRLEGFADVHAGPVQGFVELQSDFAPGKRTITMVDADNLDLEQAFVALVEPLGEGVLKLRVGRQQFAFDLQRFVSVRDGPNVRQSFDALWGDYEIGPWRIIGYYSQPVVNRDVRPFDDYSSGHNQFYGLRVERHVFGGQELSAYWSRFTNDSARYLTVSGIEQRDVWDGRFAGHARGYDWDVEGMGQTGAVGSDRVAAWAVGSRSGYTVQPWPWSPRLGLQLDAASGDGRPGDRTLNTFNPLFSNGYYVSLSGYTGYVNFIHLKPSVTVHPLPQLALMLAGAAQWRETTADAVYTQPNIPVPRTAGVGHAWTGAYAQTRMDWRVSEHVTSAVEVVHFVVGDTLRDAGGRNSDYFGVEGDYAW
jgi:hypothetical protein